MTTGFAPTLLVGTGTVLVLLILLAVLAVRWRRRTLLLVSVKTAALALTLAMKWSTETAQQLVETFAVFLDVPATLLRVRRGPGGTRITLFLCGPAIPQARRMGMTLGVLRFFIRQRLPPWCVFEVVEAPEDPGPAAPDVKPS